MAPSKNRILIGLASAAVAPLAIVACNGIIGLDDYQRVECTGRVCDGGSNPFDAPIGDSKVDSNTQTDGGFQGTDPVSWARWPMPNYDAGPTLNLPNQPQLEVTGNEVSDRLTDLVWQSTQQNNGVLVSFEVAQRTCRELAPVGQWRVPKRIELVTLLDYGRQEKPLIDTTKFPGFKRLRVWTSSAVRPFKGGLDQKYWTVNFDDGAVKQDSGEAASILCVKAKQP